jgi:hypothetical protein
MTGMADEKELTVRTWSATANAEGAGDYTRYFTGTLLPRLRELPGFQGAYLLRRDLDEEAPAGGPFDGTAGGTAGGTVELTAHTLWESLQAIHAFAGNDIAAAIVEPEARAMLLDFDRTATHRSVAAHTWD